MKRLLVAVVVGLVAISMSGAGAATVQRSSTRNFNTSGPLPAGGYLNVNASSYVTSTVGGAESTSLLICFDMFDSLGNFDSGCGPASSFSLDPALLSGSVFGVLSGRFGPVVISATYTGTHFNTTPPAADLELLQGPPAGAILTAFHYRQGRGSATANTVNGTFSFTNTGAFAVAAEYVSVTS